MNPSIRIALGLFGVFPFILAAREELDVTIVGIVCGLALVFIALDPGEDKS